MVFTCTLLSQKIPVKRVSEAVICLLTKCASGGWLNIKTSRTVKPLNIESTLGNKIVYHSDVVGAAQTGDAPTTSSFST